MRSYEHGSSDDLMAWSRLLVAAVILGVPVMALHMMSMYSSAVRGLVMRPALCRGGVTAGQVIMVALNVPLQFGVGYRFYRSAILGDSSLLARCSDEYCCYCCCCYRCCYCCYCCCCFCCCYFFSFYCSEIDSEYACCSSFLAFPKYSKPTLCPVFRF